MKSNSNYLLYYPDETNGAAELIVCFSFPLKIYVFVNVTYIEKRKTYIINSRTQFVS